MNEVVSSYHGFGVYLQPADARATRTFFFVWGTCWYTRPYFVSLDNKREWNLSLSGAVIRYIEIGYIHEGRYLSITRATGLTKNRKVFYKLSDSIVFSSYGIYSSAEACVNRQVLYCMNVTTLPKMFKISFNCHWDWQDRR